MLALTFQIGDERLALDVRHIREVVPRVQLRRVSGSPDWLAGVFVYRGDVVPVIDLHRLAGAECPPHLSSRIILAPLSTHHHPSPPHPYPSPPGGEGKEVRGEGQTRWPEGQERFIGLLATQVDVARDLRREGQPVPSMRGADQADFGAVYATSQGVFRFLELDRLLPKAAWQQLLNMPPHPLPLSPRGRGEGVRGGAGT